MCCERVNFGGFHFSSGVVINTNHPLRVRCLFSPLESATDPSVYALGRCVYLFVCFLLRLCG
jgi:hypothetical protein